MKNAMACALLVAASMAGMSAQSAPPKSGPGVDQILSLKRVASPELSPDGRMVAYTVRETNWDENATRRRSGWRM
jgi:hypothetical protein